MIDYALEEDAWEEFKLQAAGPQVGIGDPSSGNNRNAERAVTFCDTAAVDFQSRLTADRQRSPGYASWNLSLKGELTTIQRCGAR